MASDKIVGYFNILTNNAKRERIRGLKITDKIPIGLGTIYSWDFAFVKDFEIDQTPVGKSKSNTTYFRYIGQAAQISTIDRIKGHVEGAGGGASKKAERARASSKSRSKKENEDNPDRKTYEGLAAAIKGDFKRTVNFPTDDTIATGDERIVRVVHVASLFDLAALEAYMIKVPDNLIDGASTFGQMIQKNGLVGLNTLSSGVNAINAGTKTAGEAIAAAFYYLTEDDKTVKESRSAALTGENLENPTTILRQNNNDYKLATKQVFKNFHVDGKYRIDGPAFNELLNNFYKKVGSGISQGIKLDANQNVDIASKFGNADLKIIMAFQGADEQILKGLFFQLALKENNLNESSSKKLYKEVVELKNSKIGKPAVLLSTVNKIYRKEFTELGRKLNTIDFKKSKEKPLDILTEDLIKSINKSNPKLKIEGKSSFFSINMTAFEKKQTDAGKFNYLSKEDIELLRDLILSYVLGYIEITDGLFPSSSEISTMLGYFKESNSNNIANRIMEQGVSQAEAKKMAAQFLIKGQYTKK